MDETANCLCIPLFIHPSVYCDVCIVSFPNQNNKNSAIAIRISMIRPATLADNKMRLSVSGPISRYLCSCSLMEHTVRSRQPDRHTGREREGTAQTVTRAFVGWSEWKWKEGERGTSIGRHLEGGPDGEKGRQEGTSLEYVSRGGEERRVELDQPHAAPATASVAR